jgi:hypothetical protein
MSTSTSNLGLIKPDESDYIDLTTFNNNSDKIDALGVDYVKSYTYNDSNGWSYRIWNSGFCECWKTVTKTPTSDGALQFVETYPQKFKEVAVVTATAKQEYNQSLYIGFTRGTTSDCDIRVMDVSSASGQEVRLSIHVTGVISTS